MKSATYAVGREKVREYAHIAGLLMLLAIMILAFKNDIERQWPQIVDELTAQ